MAGSPNTTCFPAPSVMDNNNFDIQQFLDDIDNNSPFQNVAAKPLYSPVPPPSSSGHTPSRSSSSAFGDVTMPYGTDYRVMPSPSSSTISMGQTDTSPRRESSSTVDTVLSPLESQYLPDTPFAASLHYDTPVNEVFPLSPQESVASPSQSSQSWMQSPTSHQSMRSPTSHQSMQSPQHGTDFNHISMAAGLKASMPLSTPSSTPRLEIKVQPQHNG